MIAFQPKGNLASFTGATSAPTSVQSLGPDSGTAQQYVLTNTDTTNACVVGWGQSDTEAKLNAAAAAGVVRCYYLLANSQVVITSAPGAYFSGITSTSTAVVKVQVGIGA
jgi:hypothetical protein